MLVLTAVLGTRLRDSVRRSVAVGLLSLLVAATVATPASAGEENQDDDVVSRYQLALTLDPDGVAHAVLDLEMDFGTEPNHGPYLTYVVKERYDDTQDRVYRLTDVQVDSPSGAPDQVEVEDEGNRVAIRIGDEDRGDLTGVHTYRITYDVEGWVNSGAVFGNESDELYLDVISEWELPVEDVTVSVEGPAEVTEALCFAGEPRGARCGSASADAAVATFRHEALAAGEDLTVVAAFPAGTFGGVGPVLQDRWSFTRAFALTPLTGGLAALLTAAGVAAVLGRIRKGRQGDRQGSHGTLTPALAPVPVQLTPPAGFRPGQLGTLLDGRADAHDVTATLVDLAVRGHLRIEVDQEPDDARASDWRLVRLEAIEDGALLAYENRLLTEVFADRTTVLLSDLRTTFASSMGKVQKDLYDDVTARGWFRGNPASVRTAWLVAGTSLVLLGLVVTVVLAMVTSFALLGLPVLVVGIVVLALSGAAPARTPEGTAVLAQVRGFRDHLATAQGDQLQPDRQDDLFSRYLPFAIAFGLTERWANGFAELAAQGRQLPSPTWYVWPAYAHGVSWGQGGAFASDLTRFTETAGEAISTAPATSGSSGTSGGFSGGGVGGGGGGSW